MMWHADKVASSGEAFIKAVFDLRKSPTEMKYGMEYEV